MKKYLKIGLFKSKGRIIKETISKYRTPFQREIEIELFIALHSED